MAQWLKLRATKSLKNIKKLKQTLTDKRKFNIGEDAM